jgi:CheY-like chemotaxis protein
VRCHHFVNLRFVKTADEAIEVIEHHYFDMIVTDLNRPGTHRIDFIKHIRSSKGIIKKTKIFVITANAEQDEVEVTFGVKIDGFMTKPFDGKAFYIKKKTF